MSKVYEYFKNKLENNGPEHPSEMEPEGDPVTNCCSAPFTYPGYPDSDFCSQCLEHASVEEDDDYHKDIKYDR